MLPYAARAVPWAIVAVGSVLVLVMMEVVREWPWTMWPLEGISVGLLAAATAWCFDEPAAGVVDAAPRSLAWRTLARAGGPLVLLAAWVTAVHRSWDSLFGHPWEVALQGVAAMLAAGAIVTWRRAGGVPAPGRAFANGVVPVAAFLALLRPISGTVPVFPYADGSGDFGDWGVSRGLWATLALVAVVTLAAALADARWWRAAVRAGRRRDRAAVGP